MQVRSLWRHPVKSLRGEAISAAQVDGDGLHSGDRSWGVHDDAAGRVLTGRRGPRLLDAAATLDTNGNPQITLPDGTTFIGDELRPTPRCRHGCNGR